MTFFTAITAWVATSFAVSLATAGIITNLAIGVALMGIQTLLASGQQRQTTSTPQAQATLNQSTGQRLRGYGRGKLGGTRAFFDSYSGFLFQIVMAHHGRIDAFEEWWIGDRLVTLIDDDSGMVNENPFFRHVQLYFNHGDGETNIRDIMMLNWPEVWTTEHRLFGIAHFLAVFTSPKGEDLQAIFPQGHDTPIRAVARLSLVWDPRDPAQDPDDESTWLWSDTASLCILDYLKHPDGYRRSLDDIDVQSFIDFADICDEAVPLAAGGTEKRYRLWGVYGLTDDPQDVLGKMRATCDAEFYQTAEGKIAIRGGAWQAPTVTITEADILGHSMEQGNNRFAAFNELKLLYTSADHDFQTMEATSWVDLADQAERGVLQSSLTLDMVPSASQARRLAKIHVAKANPAWKGTIVANLAALDALGERTIRVVLPELEIDDAFFVAGFSIRPDLTGVEISVMSINEASYTWTTAEEGAAAPIPEDTRPNLEYPVPAGLALTLDGDFVVATVDATARTDLTLQAQIRAGAGSLWQEMEVEPGAFEARFGPVAAGDYQVHARWLGPSNTAGPWTTPLAEIEVP